MVHAINRDAVDTHFGTWNDYRFVWVLSHGAYLPPDTDPPDYTAIYSSRECGMTRWFYEDVIPTETGRDGTTRIATLFGLPRDEIESELTPLQQQRWRNFRDTELQGLKQRGQGCGSLEMPDAALPVLDDNGQPILREPAFIDYIYYDEAWFDAKYAGGLDNVLLYLSVCSSDTVPIPASSSNPSTTFGWSEPMDSQEDNRASDFLFERMIELGETVEDAFEKVGEANLDSHQFDGKTASLSPKSLRGGARGRVREIVTIVDSELALPLPDEGAYLDAREITNDGRTLVDISVKIVGFGKRPAEDFEVQFFDANGNAISSKFEVDEPVNDRTVMTIPISLAQEITTPTDVEIEARVNLPEEGSDAYSSHKITLTVGPAIESLWSLTVGGAGTARGDFVFAPSPVGVRDEEGRLVWSVVLSQLDGGSAVPLANIIIVGHAGRTPECTGQTGIFDGLVTITFTDDPMPSVAYGGGLGVGECGDSVDVEIVSFSKEEDLVATVNGTICEARGVGGETVVTPVLINGSFQMPSAGCGADPGGDALGSYTVAEAPGLCFDIYPNAAIAGAFEETCMQGGIACSDDPCSTAGQIGQCDYRDDSVNITFRGQVQHFYPGGDWPSVGDLQLACEFQLGVWTTGEPPTQ